MTRFFAYVLVLAAGIGGWHYYKWSRGVPDVAFQDAKGQLVKLSDMRGDRADLSLAFLVPGCGFSQHSVTLVKTEAKAHPDIAFAGLLMGATREGAEAYRKENGLDFPVYGTMTDPVAHNALVKSVGTWRGIWGGTIVVVDSRQRVVFQADRDQVDRLSAALQKIDPI
jgi:hypothetical protein